MSSDSLGFPITPAYALPPAFRQGEDLCSGPWEDSPFLNGDSEGVDGEGPERKEGEEVGETVIGM